MDTVMTSPAPDSATSTPAPRRRVNKDQPLIDDIRLLGRLLGDVIREQ